MRDCIVNFVGCIYLKGVKKIHTPPTLHDRDRTATHAITVGTEKNRQEYIIIITLLFVLCE